jgi:hypothetical protein
LQLLVVYLKPVGLEVFLFLGVIGVSARCQGIKKKKHSGKGRRGVMHRTSDLGKVKQSR